MLQTYLRIAFRSLLKDKTFSLINVAGLAMGMAISIIIIQFVMHEWSYDTFHKNGKHIYRVLGINKKNSKGGMHIFPSGLAPQLAKENPEIKNTVRFVRDWSAIIKNPDKPAFINIEKGGLFVDPSFLSIFSFPMKYGNAADVLEKPFGMVISESMSKKYFGDFDPIGRKISYNSGHLFEITGVTADVPANSTIQFDFLIPLQTYAKFNQFGYDNYPSFETFFFIENIGALPRIERNIKPANKLMHSAFYNEEDTYKLEPLSELRFDGTASSMGLVSQKILYIFSGIAALILLLALFNYINLATARATIRAKEVGVRKSVGAKRFNLIKQFFTESALVTFLAFLLGISLVLMFRERFNQFFGLNIDPSFLLSQKFIVVMIALFSGTAFLAGVYPAFVISRFAPVRVLRGNYFGKNQGAALRRTFMVFQFTVSATLILCSLIIWQQTSYMNKKDLGFDKNQVLSLRLGDVVPQKSQSFKQDVSAISGLQKVSMSNTSFFEGYAMAKFKTGPDRPAMDMIKFEADADFVANMGLKWKIAPNKNMQTNAAGFYLTVNETAVKELGYPIDRIVGQTIYYQEGLVLGTVSGVVRDFDLLGPQVKTGPMLFMVKKPTLPSDGFRFMQLRLNPKDDIRDKLAALEEVYRTYDKETPFQYSFLDDNFQKAFLSQTRITGMIRMFTGIAVLLACLGLLGLITFVGQTRRKEISIRKVMGASVANIFAMLSKDFIILISISVLIAFPLAYYGMEQWLQGFAYRIRISWPVFALGGILSLAIALLTISIQGLKAALTNPVEALRAD